MRPTAFLGRDDDKLPDFTPDYAEACFGVDAVPASGRGARSAAAPAAGTASSTAATPAPFFPVVGPAAPIRGVDRAVAVSGSRPPQALARGTPAEAAFAAAASGAAAPQRSQELSPPRASAGAVVGGTRGRALRATAPSATPHDPTGGGQGRRPFRLRQQDGPEDGAHVRAGPRRAAPVVRFAACCILAVCHSSLPIMPLPVPPSASLAAPHNRTERDS